MNVVQITPGAGAMYCGNCLRDNALVRVLRQQGHNVLMVPLYLPLTLDETDQSAGTPLFFGGISVYLEQKSAFFRTAPDWLHEWLSSRWLLRWAAGRAAKTQPVNAGELTLSMLRGEAGHQARELEQLVSWLKTQPAPDVVCLSNALLLGMARRLKAGLGAPIVCMLQGEDSFLDGLPEPHRGEAWRLLAQRAAEVNLFITPSRYFGERMAQRLRLPADRVRVVYNGINLDGYAQPAGSAIDRQTTPGVPVLGYFARMCREKGLDTLVDAFVLLRKGGRVPELRLRIGGSCGPADEPFVAELRRQLNVAGLSTAIEFCPNLSRAAKLDFLKSLTIFSVPAVYGEAFGLYVIEALAAGVPVVQPRTAAFPELIETTSGGVLCEPQSPTALAAAIEALLLDPPRARALGESGRRAVFEKFSAEAMAREMSRRLEEICKPQV
jgi:glycosyltransferase involved in cell wall biosynthesis